MACCQLIESANAFVAHRLVGVGIAVAHHHNMELIFPRHWHFGKPLGMEIRSLLPTHDFNKPTVHVSLYVKGLVEMRLLFCWHTDA